MQPTGNAKDAATVLLLRQGAQGPEVFMQVRSPRMAFAAGAAVFPGGSVDPSDLLGTEDWGTPEVPGALLAAAIRETFEECGVLLAAPASSLPDAAGPGAAVASPGAGAEREAGSGVVAVGADAAWPGAAERAALTRHERGIAEVLATAGLLPELSALALVDRWITPEGEPRRYDTRFLASVLPEGAEADGLTTESVSSFWVRPQDALARYGNGELSLMPPTWAQLERLSRAGDVQEGLQPATTGVTCPTLRQENGRMIAQFWGTPEYLAAGPA